MTRTRAIKLVATLILTLAVIGAAVALALGGGGDPVVAAGTTPATAAPRSPSGTVPGTAAGGAADPTGAPAATDDTGAAGVAPEAPAVGSGSDRTGPAVHEVITGTHGTPPPAGPDDLIGELDDDGPVPAGLDLVAAPEQPAGGTGLGGPGSLADAPSCAHQCITSGRAYPRGFGAELVVQTSVPTSLYLSLVADLDHDGVYEDLHVDSTDLGATEHHSTFDDLEPGTTYHAMAAATDEHGHTAYAWGTFTTLAHRDVFVELGDLTVDGGPNGIDATTWLLGVDGPLTDATPGQQGILLYKDVARTIDLDLWVVRSWDDEVCEVWQPPAGQPHGHDSAACLAWSSTSVDVDLDQAPAGKSRWTSTSVALTLHQPTGDPGDALPPGYGDPYWFDFSVPVTLHVTYR